MIKQKTIQLVAAARPNFMKIAPLYHALAKESWAKPEIIHTGQHYDLNMSDVFFHDLRLHEPHQHLGVGSGSHAQQTGQVMIAFENALLKQRPDLVVVVGDVNSTMACTIAAVKLGVPVAHLEAGLRSFDRTMPEEINRIVTDSIADILWTPSPDGDQHLLEEGVHADKIERVGNIMIDSFEMLRESIETENVYSTFNLDKGRFGVVTLHRPSNVDHPENLARLCDLLVNVSENIPLIFPLHPRTRKQLEVNGLKERLESKSSLILTEPLSYARFMNLVVNCCFALTDSGGIQEETSYLNIPCLTLRPNTERPVTVEQGTNTLCTLDNVGPQIDAVLSGNSKAGQAIELWDGNTAERVVASIQRRLA